MSLNDTSRECSSIISQVEENYKLPLLICFAIISPIAIAGNSVVLWLFIKYKCLRKPSTRYVVSLAIGDLILGCVYAPVLIIQLSLKSDDQNCLLNTAGKFLTSLFAISGITIASIAYDRYIVMFSRYTKTPARWKANFLLIAPWFSPILLLLSKLTGRLVNTVTVLVLMTVLYAIVFISYMKLVHIINAYSTSKIKVVGESNIKEIMAKNKNAAVFVGAIIAATLVFTLPIYINRCFLLAQLIMRDNWDFYTEKEPLILAITHVVFLLSAAVDPYIYVFKHRDFKKKWRKAIGKNNRATPNH